MSIFTNRVDSTSFALPLLAMGLCIFATACVSEEGATDCSEYGTIPAPITEDYTVEPGCYTAGTLRVEQGVLTVSPGVTIVFSEGGYLEVASAGRLNAVGTEEDPIFLTAEEKDRGFWRGVYLADSKSSQNALAYVTIEYGGSRGWGASSEFGQPSNLVVNDSRISLANVTLRQSGGYGLHLLRDTQVEMSGPSHITENAGRAARVSPYLVSALNSESDYSGNDIDEIEVDGHRLSEDTRWRSLNVPIAFFTLVVEAELTIDAGNELVAADAGYIEVADVGEMAALGEEGRPVIFRGAQATAGYWRGIRYGATNSTHNRLEYVTIRDGGARAWGASGEFGGPANLTLHAWRETTRVSAHHLTLENSDGFGLWAGGENVIFEVECESFSNDSGEESEDPICS